MNCPHCLSLIPFNTLHIAWKLHSCPVAFPFDCPNCSRSLIVDTQSVPDFHLYDPLTSPRNLSDDLKT